MFSVNNSGAAETSCTSVADGVLHISGVDLVDGTPILDVKPYIPSYDTPANVEDGALEPADTARCAPWVGSSPGSLRVDFTPSALADLGQFHVREGSHGDSCAFCLRHLTDSERARQALVSLLSADPRSLHRKNNCADRLYYCVVDVIHVTAWFDDDRGRVEVLRLAPLAMADDAATSVD